jgi:hypothetical protein
VVTACELKTEMGSAFCAAPIRTPGAPTPAPACSPRSPNPSNSLFGWLVADDWCWFVMKEEYCWLVADD